ncbi:type II toxin-antitoxin system prevent-host-death family antitoxin [Microbacterium esteraromaticum]|uniref:Type II toxin-antitoxin system prevent-host-death family antitoxin n=1 Tax=Microbacterium esteraromaticum TaxID=57043 RepID=A0A7D7W807_9MICO|nr:type II toxin-antitoxin system prevent-host-death family antitoxin [Microbacterium esteraromaticum]QMU96575.1 type II toxin-antitoxin system prevent-host-death family antitoxin [Microbacterium esteraromaticum]
MTVQVNMHEAKSQLSALVERVLAGEQVTIARAGTPVIDLVVHRTDRPVIGALRGEFSYDAEAFDGADGEIREMFYGSDD